MISFRDCTREFMSADFLRRLIHLVRAGDVESLLVEAGVLEQGVMDVLCSREDSWGPVQALLRDLLLHAGKAYVHEADPALRTLYLREASSVLDRLSRNELPTQATARIPEGYLHYALDPRDYARAARSYVQECGIKRAAEAVVLGVRSIGTSLSAVVAAVTGSSRTLTIRPRGNSGHRSIAVDRSLTACLREWIKPGCDVLVVDEGPGATGETLFCMGQWLGEMGVTADHVVLFPSHTGGMGLAPEERKIWFAVQRKYPPREDNGRMQRVAQALGLFDPENLSGGMWRNVVSGAELFPANVNHERLKFRARDVRGDLHMVRYAGLGTWGQETVRRAECLSAMGAGPEMSGYAHGFMAYRWQEGWPGSYEMATSPAFRRAVGGYLSARWNCFGIGKAATAASIIPAIQENTCEALGPDPDGLTEVLRRLETLPETEAVIADARLQLVEWVRSPDGFVKVDSFDHGDGTRLPGPVHPAWDIAGAAVEYSMDDFTVASLIDGLPTQGTAGSGLQEAVAVYRVAYAACCLGEADIAAREASVEEDRARLAREAARYREVLRRELAQFA